MKRVLLLRHGETEENQASIGQGQSDGTLTDRGRRQARAAGRYLATRKIDRAVTSDLGRARQTLIEILQFIACPWTTDVRLREGNYGEFEGRPSREYRQVLEESGHSTATFLPKGGEDFAAMHVRVVDFLAELRRADGDESVLVVTHGGTICHMLTSVQDLPPEAVLNHDIDNASITELEIDGESIRITAVNDTRHLNDDPTLKGPQRPLI